MSYENMFKLISLQHYRNNKKKIRFRVLMELQNVNLFQRLRAVNKLKHWK